MLSRIGEIHETRRGLPGDPNDEQSRYIETAVGGVLVAGLYLPNGHPRPGPKFAFHLRWFDRLHTQLAGLVGLSHPAVLTGRFTAMTTRPDFISPPPPRDAA